MDPNNKITHEETVKGWLRSFWHKRYFKNYYLLQKQNTLLKKLFHINFCLLLHALTAYRSTERK
jgi:hypothetical protein